MAESAEPDVPTEDGLPPEEHQSLKYHLLGPSLTKAGQDSVDQSKVCIFFFGDIATNSPLPVSEIIYNASKGSKFFHHEEARDKILTEKIDRILARKQLLDTQDLGRELRRADALVAQLEASRDLGRIIVHIDCDAFYAAVEQLDRPELVDVPFAVGGGVLTTCNYAARRFGCRSGMAAFVAKRLCPQLRLLPLRFDRYRAVATDVRTVLARYDPTFEPAGIDEAYVDLTAYCADHPETTVDEAVRRMRAEVHEHSRVTVSAGIAANARLAKICSNVNKPDGQFSLARDRDAILAFMRDLPCRKVNGIGRVLERELAALGIRTCGGIYPQRRYLSRLFGDKACEFLLRCHLGLGRTVVRPTGEHERKSVGTERTFSDDSLSDPARLRDRLRATAADLERDLGRAACKGRTLVLKIKLHTYEVYTRQVVAPRPLHLAGDLYAHALPMLARLEREIPDMRLRLMGLRCTHLVSTKKPDALAFFGLKRRRDSAASTDHPAATDDEWERWPDGPPDDDDYEGEEADATRLRTPDIDRDSPAPEREASTAPPAEKEEWWECPICARPQPAEEKRFNDHIDACLSRQAIRDVVQQQEETSQQQSVSVPDEGPGRKRRGRPPSQPGPRQKRLCFG